jgi:ApaG protein
MNPPEEIAELKGLRVTVDRVIYNADFEGPADRPYCFVYHISIHNGSDEHVAIKGRKWVVTNASGDVTAVEGAGVVGQFPELDPGDTFSYNSFHLLETKTGAAEGSYLGIDTRGRKVRARIPRFEMKAGPRTAV